MRWPLVAALVLSAALGRPSTAGPEALTTDRLEIEADIPVSGDFMAYDFGALWMMSGGDLVKVDPADNQVTRMPVKGAVGPYRGIATGEGAIWVADTGTGTLFKLDPADGRVLFHIPILTPDSEGSIAVGHGSVWVVEYRDQNFTHLRRYDSLSGAVQNDIPLAPRSIAALATPRAVWVSNPNTNEVYRVDPATNTVLSTTKASNQPRFLAAGFGAIWVLNQGNGKVQRLDEATGAVVATIETAPGFRPGGDIAVGGGYVWVTLTPDLPVLQIDPETNMLFRTFQGDNFGDAIRFGAGSVWVSGASLRRLALPG